MSMNASTFETTLQLTHLQRRIRPSHHQRQSRHKSRRCRVAIVETAPSSCVAGDANRATFRVLCMASAVRRRLESSLSNRWRCSIAVAAVCERKKSNQLIGDRQRAPAFHSIESLRTHNNRQETVATEQMKIRPLRMDKQKQNTHNSERLLVDLLLSQSIAKQIGMHTQEEFSKRIR